MKTLSYVLLAVSLVIYLACGETESPVKPDTEIPIATRGVAKGKVSSFIPVATFDPQTGKPTILVDNFVKTFEDGGPIKYFGVRKLGSEYGFVRMGYDAQGHYQSQTFRTTTQGSSLGLAVGNFKAVWYILCSGTCFGCMASSNGSQCNCDTSLEISDGKLVIVDGSGQEQDPDDQDNPGGNCAAGSGGSSLYDNVVFH